MPFYIDGCIHGFDYFMRYYHFAVAYKIRDFATFIIDEVYGWFCQIRKVPTLAFWNCIFQDTTSKSKPRQLIIDHVVALIDNRWIIDHGSELIQTPRLAVPVMAALSDQKKDRKAFFNKEVYLKSLKPSER